MTETTDEMNWDFGAEAKPKAEAKPTRAAIEKRKVELDDADRVIRPSLHDVLGTFSQETRGALVAATAARAFRAHRFHTPMFEVDMLEAFSIGKRIMITGQPHCGKSLLCYLMMAAAQRTCRYCFAPIVEWRYDWEVFKENPASWTPTTGRVERRCLCGRNVPMIVMWVDAEDQFDPVWASTWGVDLGDWSNYDQVDFEAVDQGVWTGTRISKDARVLVCRPSSSAVIDSVLLPMIKSGACDLVIVDSIAGFAIEEDLQGTSRIASRARFLRRFMPLVVSAQLECNKNFGGRVSVLMTNHFMQGPTMNPHMNPNTPVGGKAVEYLSDMRVEMFSRPNQGLPKDDQKGLVIMRDISLRTPKMRGFHNGAEGVSRLFLNDYSSDGRIRYRAGDTDNPERILTLIRAGESDPQLDDPELWRIEKSGTTVKQYWLAGRPFKKLKDIAEFIRRDDVYWLLKFILFARHLPEAARQNLEASNYLAGADPDDPLTKLVLRYGEKTGANQRKARQNARKDGPSAAPAAVSGPEGKRAKSKK
jgi:RecA/RadA recombinase